MTTDTPARQPHPQRCETCDYRYHADVGKCPYDFEDNYYLLKDEMRLPKGAWVFTSITGCASHSPHTNPTAKTPQECENRNCLDCPLLEQCHITDEMPMCARATYDGVRKNAAKDAREQVLAELRIKIEEMGFPLLFEKTEFDEGRACAYGFFVRAIESLRVQQEQP